MIRLAAIYALCSVGAMAGWLGLVAQGWPIDLLWPVLALSLLYAVAGLWLIGREK